MTRRLVVATALTLLVVSGCALDDSTGSEPSSSTTEVITLLKGSASSTTLTSTTLVASTTATPGTTPFDRGVVLQPDGLGIVQFGEPLVEVIAELESALGPPTLAEAVEPDSPSNTEFHAYWLDAGLHIGFSTYPFFREDGQLHFTWWHTWLPHELLPEDVAKSQPVNPVETAAGIGRGSTLNELMDAYGDRFWISSHECGSSAMIAPYGDVPGEPRDADGHPRWIIVFFDKGIDDPGSARVVGMEAGAGDGC